MKPEDGTADSQGPQGKDHLRQLEQESIEKMRCRMASEAELQQMAESLGTDDEKILRALQALGFTRETVVLLHLVPLVQVAWAEGRVTQRERRLIFAAARLRGIKDGTSAYEKLAGWLDFQPTQEFFEKALSLVREVLRALPPEEHESGKLEFLSLCTEVAEASGGATGFVGGGRRICTEEQELISRIMRELGRPPDQEVSESLNLAEAAPIENSTILRKLQDLGYTCEMAMLIYLVPLVQVAWAGGTVVERERKIILAMARFNGIQEGSPADKKLVEMLDNRPSTEFFELTLQALSNLLDAIEPELRLIDAHDLLTLCTSVAEASNESTGFNVDEGNVCYEEQQTIDRISQGLKVNRIGAFSKS